MTTKIGKKTAAMRFLNHLSREPISFGALLRTIRETDELTQHELAERVGTSISHLCDIEKGRKVVSPERAARFARALGYSEALFVQLALQDQLAGAGLCLRVQVQAV